ncbi:MAG: lysylphosphatidylglycerol synthase transmembrane domain-containing protein [Candidatus Acidiferrum sp.]
MQSAAQVPRAVSKRQIAQQKSLHPYWKWPIAFGLAGVLLYLALRGVEWRRVGNIVARCRVGYLMLACGCATLSYLVRAKRWRILLNAQERLAYTTVLWANSAGYLANNYLPARAGELVRTGMISSRSRLSKTYVFTTVMTERVLELVILVLMASLTSLTLAYRPVWLARLMLFTTVGAIAGIALLLLLPGIDRTRTGFIARLPLGSKMKDLLHGIAGSVTLALTALRDPLRSLRVCGATALVWMLDATAAVILAHALGMQLLFSVALLLSTGLALGNVLPSTPGAIGISQFAAVTVLMPFNFTQTDAIAYILVAQAVGYFVTTVLGLIGLWRYRASAAAETAVI